MQGKRLKAKREIGVASLFKRAPAPFLKMIVVHELAHLKEREHDKAFTRIVCRNCHRKLEMGRDVAKLTKNGKRQAPETEDESLFNYCMRFADDLETSSASLRRKATLFVERKKRVGRGE